MAISTNDSTSTGSFNMSGTTNNCANCPQVVSGNTGTPTTWGDLETFAHYFSDIEKLKNEVTNLREGQSITNKFYAESKKLTKTSRIAIIILMIIPALQLLACAAVVYYLGIQEKISSFINWILSGVSFLSILEVVFTALKYFNLENRVTELEKKQKLQVPANNARIK